MLIEQAADEAGVPETTYPRHVFLVSRGKLQSYKVTKLQCYNVFLVSRGTRGWRAQPSQF